MTVKVQVFPSKLDYEEDYKNILDDINQEIYNWWSWIWTNCSWNWVKRWESIQSRRILKN